MQKQRQLGKRIRMRCLPSFFVGSIMVMNLLGSVGSMMLLPPGRVAAQAVRQRHNNGITNAVLYDETHHHYYTYNTPGQFIAASSIKVPIMLTFLDMIERQGRKPASHEMRLLTTMIENSNNASASVFYNKIGGASGTARFLRKIGVTGLQPNPKAWGYSLVTPLAMVNLLTRLYEGHILTEHDRQLALSLMEHVQANQRAGVGDTAPRGARVALKDGWVPGPDGLWAVNSSGIVVAGRETYILSVYTKEEPSLEAGRNAVRQICRTMISRLP